MPMRYYQPLQVAPCFRPGRRLVPHGGYGPEAVAGVSPPNTENSKKPFLKAAIQKISKKQKALLTQVSKGCIIVAQSKEGETMKVGYVRVSTEEQNTARQDVLMEQLGVEKVFVDKASGKSKDRPGLTEMMAFVREGDTVIVESISRFARSTKDLLNLVEQLTAKKVEFVSQKETIDTSTPQGRFMLTVFAAMAQLEREQTRQRQAEGIAIAKAQGKYRGRKPIAVDEALFTEQYRLWKNGETSPKFMMKKLGLTHATFYRKVAEYERNHGIKTDNG